ncbi:MAG: TIGR02391 family protein [Solirubrobacteraceae bacterium]
MTGTPPPVVDEILNLDDDGLALWLLRQLDTAPPNERGRNYVSERLAAWFPETKAIGAVQQVDQFGIPKASSTRPALVERKLKEAYSLLITRNWIMPDPSSGKVFCDVTSLGRRQLAIVPGSDPDRMGFAAKALSVGDLHPALQARCVDLNFRQGRFETALRDSAAFLEDSIRNLSGLPSNLVGVRLAEQAFAPAPSGPLTDPGEHAGEAAGLQRLFMGFFGAVHNRVAHTEFHYQDPKEAFQILMLVDFLTGKLDEAAQRQSKTLT